jgi:hypothetical protein
VGLARRCNYMGCGHEGYRYDLTCWRDAAIGKVESVFCGSA